MRMEIRWGQDEVQSFPDLAAAVADEGDSQKITELIEQLDRDLAETHKNTSNGR